MKSKVLVNSLTLLSIVALLVVFVNLVHASKMLSYLSSDSEVCINCHTMLTHYDSWQHSSHRERAGCVDCHLPQDSFINKMMAKAKDGYNHAWAMTFKTYGDNIQIGKADAAIVQDNCITCHSEIVSQMMANSALYRKPDDKDLQMGRYCWDCHRDVPHGTMNNLSATQTNFPIANP